MSQLGSYELLREIHRSPQAVVYAARRAGDASDRAGRYAVKAFDAESYGLLESVAAAQTFLERATIQKVLADQGAHHWAKVHELGTTDAPYYATDLYPLTAQKVVDRGAPVGVRGLHTVVVAVVRGLTEMRETYRRAHGNLKLGNILIRLGHGREDLRFASPKSTEVALADPSIEAHSARDRSADLMAIGELIHQLVLKRPSKAPKGPDDLDPPLEPEYPVAYTAAWGRLGHQGQAWLDLCNWLLSPDPADRPADLVAVSIALHQLQPRAQRRSPKWVAAAVAPLLLAAGGAGALWYVGGSARAELLAADQQWFTAFERALDDPARQQRYAADETLRTVTTMVRQAKQDGVRFDPSNDSVLSYGAYRNAKAALAVIQRVERELTPERWQRLAAQGKLRAGYESRGWTQPAAFISDLMRGVRPGPGGEVAAGIDRLMDVTGRLGPDAVWLDEQWARYEADLKVAADTGDPVLVTFARELRMSVAASLRLTDAGFDGFDAFKVRLALAERLRKVVEGGFPAAYGRDRIKQEVEPTLNVSNPTHRDVEQWLKEVPDYKLVQLDPGVQPLSGLTGSLQLVTEEVEKRQTLSDVEQVQYRADRRSVEEKLNALAGERFVRKHVAQLQGEIPLRRDEIQRELTGLRNKWVRLDDPRQWIQFIDVPLASASDVLKLRWKGYIDVQRKRTDELTRSVKAFKEIKGQAELVRGVLTELDKQFPPVTAGWPSDLFAAAAFDRRERDLRELSEWAAGADPTPPADLGEFGVTVKERGDAYANWCVKLRRFALAKDFPIAKELLTPKDRPDEEWAAKEQAFWADPIVKGLVKKDVDRINAVAAVAAMNREALKAAAAQSDAAEVAVAAWLRLGEPAPGAPAWPATAAELDAEQSIRNRLTVLVRDVRSDAERKPVLEDLRQQGPARWRRFVNLAGLPAPGEGVPALEQRLQTAQRYITSMAATDEDVRKLDPAARFNYALHAARVALTDPAQEIVTRASKQLADAAAELKDRPEVQELARRLARVGVAEPMSADAALLAAAPPDTYVLPLADEPPLTFVRLQAKGVRPFYLSRTELSLGQFRELVKRTGNWAAANALLGNTSVPGGPAPVPLRGPRAWDRPSAANAAIERFDSWRFDGPSAAAQPFAFAVELRQSKLRFGNKYALAAEYGDNPKLDHPMQQLPAQAALYAAAASNLRLPTTKEWLAAHAAEQAQAPADGAAPAEPNLRDATWRRQQEFAAREAPSQWPDPEVSGAFWPKGQGRPPGPAAGLPGDDRTLFFRTVASGPGRFPNLVGNVAELVCDSPDAFESLPPDRRGPADVVQFCKQYGGTIMVIGGSALSPKELVLTRPYPVNSPAEPYADVGVRPAFTAPARSIAERLKGFLDEQPYLAAAAVAKAGG